MAIKLLRVSLGMEPRGRKYRYWAEVTNKVQGGS